MTNHEVLGSCHHLIDKVQNWKEKLDVDDSWKLNGLNYATLRVLDERQSQKFSLTTSLNIILASLLLKQFFRLVKKRMAERR